MSSITNLILIFRDFGVYRERQNFLKGNYNEVSQRPLRSSRILNSSGRTLESKTLRWEVTSYNSSENKWFQIWGLKDEWNLAKQKQASVLQWEGSICAAARRWKDLQTEKFSAQLQTERTREALGRNEAVHVEITSCYIMLKDFDLKQRESLSGLEYKVMFVLWSITLASVWVEWVRKGQDWTKAWRQLRNLNCGPG